MRVIDRSLALEPRLPPTVRRDEAAKLLQALAKGEPDRAKIVKDVITEHVRELT
jgi:hypothetical protein